MFGMGGVITGLAWLFFTERETGKAGKSFAATSWVVAGLILFGQWNERRVASTHYSGVASESMSRSSNELTTLKPIDWSQFKPYLPSREEPLPEQTHLWLARNIWYGKPGYEARTEKAKRIDQELAIEGYDPQSRTYFDELDRRLFEKFR